jgi:hypothetical protein
MTFAVAAGYGIAICIATTALIGLVWVARPPVSPERALAACPRESRSVQTGLFGRKDIR